MLTENQKQIPRHRLLGCGAGLGMTKLACLCIRRHGAPEFTLLRRRYVRGYSGGAYFRVSSEIVKSTSLYPATFVEAAPRIFRLFFSCTNTTTRKFSRFQSDLNFTRESPAKDALSPLACATPIL